MCRFQLSWFEKYKKKFIRSAEWMNKVELYNCAYKCWFATTTAAAKQTAWHCIWSAGIREIFNDTSEWENNWMSENGIAERFSAKPITNITFFCQHLTLDEMCDVWKSDFCKSKEKRSKNRLHIRFMIVNSKIPIPYRFTLIHNFNKVTLRMEMMHVCLLALPFDHSKTTTFRD